MCGCALLFMSILYPKSAGLSSKNPQIFIRPELTFRAESAIKTAISLIISAAALIVNILMLIIMIHEQHTKK